MWRLCSLILVAIDPTSLSDVHPAALTGDTSVNNYHTTPRNTPEDRRFNQLRGGSLKSKCTLLVALFETFGVHSKIVLFTDTFSNQIWNEVM
jgi:hypothetical protein